jgi:hypothetical protein
MKHALLIVIFDSSFDSLDFFISSRLCHFDHLDEIVHFHDGSSWVDLYDIHINEFIKTNLFSRDNITNINTTVIIVISIIVKENVLCEVIGLVD